MTRADPVPADAGAIDAAWLTRALTARHPGAVVDTVEVVSAHEATNSHARLAVGYEVTAGAPDRLFAKLAPTEPRQRARVAATGMGRREVLFYERLAPFVAMRVPTVHGTALDEGDGAFALLLEDLDASGAVVPDGRDGIPVDAAAGALEDLAELHVRYEDPARRRADAGWVPEAGSGGTYGATMLAQALAEHRDRLTGPFASIAEVYIDHEPDLQAAWRQGPATVIHGDPHIGNLFLDRGRVGFLDWGIVRVGSPLRDVGYFLTMALSIDDRRADERGLLAHYLDVRRALGGQPIDPDEAWRAHRLHAAYTVPACCQIVVFPSGISEGRRRFSEAFLARAEAAIDDLDAREAVRKVTGW